MKRSIRKFSSVAHYDRFSIELLGLQKVPDGNVMLATQPHWPTILLIQNALFDIIQCFEAAQICHKKDAAQIFEALLAQLLAVSKKGAPDLGNIRSPTNQNTKNVIAPISTYSDSRT
jgi:hypothetical protein